VRAALAIAVPLVAALIQGGVAGLMTVEGAFPSFPLLVAASWSLAAGAGEGLWWAFVAGIATDVLSGGPLGAFTVAALPGTLLVGLGERSTAKPIPVLTAAVGVALAALLAQVLYLSLLAFLGRPPGPAPVTVAQTVGVGIYTGALAILAYPLARLGRRLTEKESAF
jgi:rod shape-determining protein MreD